MTDLADRLVIKDGNVFAVVPRHGDCSGADGVWMDDCGCLGTGSTCTCVT